MSYGKKGKEGKHVVVTDLHGGYSYTNPSYDAYRGLFLPWLADDGWEIREHESGHRYLYHERDTLLVLGDVVDRGSSTVDAAELLYGSYIGNMELGIPYSVITLMGNHDIKIKHKVLSGRNISAKESLLTIAELEKAGIHKKVARWVDALPYTYNSRHFRAVHAFFSPVQEACIYGLVDDNRNRIPWWEVYSGKFTLFGHYHMEGGWLDRKKDSVCLDNLDGGLLTLGLVYEDGRFDVVKELVP